MPCQHCGGTPLNRRKARAASRVSDRDGIFTAEAYPDCEAWVPGPEDDETIRVMLVGRATDLERWFLDSQEGLEYAAENGLTFFWVPATQACDEIVTELLAAASG